MLDDTKATRHTTAESVANTFEWLITAFILAFVFRAFILEAFRIPTGSMADTLMGDHFRICCTQCGYNYEFNFNPFVEKNYQSRSTPGLYQLTPAPRCPSCGYYENPNILFPKSNGDRILVFKSIYQFIEPKRWDVVVFKNPNDPKENYIKRLIAKPGETVEIIDGDVYINNVLQRKPPKVQQEMRMCIYNNDYQPIQPKEGRFNNHQWRQPFTNDKDSQWKWDPARPTEFTLQSGSDKSNTMFYDTSKGNDFRAVYAYDDTRYYRGIPFCSDLMMNYYAKFKGDNDTIGIGLSKYETLYKAAVNSQGIMTIEKIDSSGKITELARKQIPLPLQNKNLFVQFANVDHLLTFEFNGQKLSFDLGTGKDDAGPRRSEIEPKAFFFGSGSLTIEHVALYRDIHYLGVMPNTRQPVDRAGENNPFKVGKDEFFVMGDNSPDSLDSRLWNTEGLGNNGNTYRKGIVPRDYLVGEAFFVYWPGGFRIDSSRLAIVPNVGRMRFIYGGM